MPGCNVPAFAKGRTNHLRLIVLDKRRSVREAAPEGFGLDLGIPTAQLLHLLVGGPCETHNSVLPFPPISPKLVPRFLFTITKLVHSRC